MRVPHVHRLEEFGTRSLVTHGLMVVTFLGAVLAGLFVDGQFGLVSFVALVNFTGGLWVAHSIHSLGHVQGGGEYVGVLAELRDDGDPAETETDREGFDTGRFARLFTLIAAVTAVSLLTSARLLGGALLAAAVVGVGTIALITAMIGFLISLGSSYDAAQAQAAETVESGSETRDA
ncbi:hypothetical protein [Saliphagus sp. LR7]|uniref:hypothetical protein n=1 Tax=Saliphagus sp. LR7 TaxID=2282654 RepID=UPI000DF76C21|nr:hypothetical protein [Saliphagus sp. LR7]